MFASQPIWGSTYLVHDMTTDELLRLPDDGSKNELYKGVLIKEEMTSPLHGVICHRLSFFLGMYALNTGFPNAMVQNTLFNLTSPGAQRNTTLAPDLAILRPGVIAGRTVPTDVPLLAVEVISPSQTLAELRIKAQFYRAVGVDEIWLVDPDTRLVEIWNATSTNTLNESETLTSTLLPGFSLAVKTLLDG
jgi:Uma2 family endonuclease